MYISVLLFLHEMRMLLKIIFLRVLQNEICSRMKDVFCKHLVRKCCKIFKSVRWISKDYIELLASYFEELEDIVAYDCEIIHTESGSLGLYEIGVQREHLHTIDS